MPVSPFPAADAGKPRRVLVIERKIRVMATGFDRADDGSVIVWDGMDPAGSFDEASAVYFADAVASQAQAS